MAVTGGATAALTATAMWWARRQARLGERERVAREAPWMLTPREFASVASRLYKVERCETDAGRVTSLVDRTTNTPLFSIQHEKDAPLSKRELLTAAHLEMVEEASRVQGLTVPPRVAQAHLDEAMRTTPPGFAAYGRRAAALGQLVGLGQASDTGRVTMAASQASVGAAAGGAATQAAAEKFWESVPVIRLSPDAPAERREKIAAQVRQLPPERQDAVRDRTAQRYADLAKSGNLAEAAKLQAGLSVLATEMAQRRVAAELERGAPSGNRGRGRKSADRGMGL
jgi:RNA polymerase-interacting CarD/CdnL/TRCF family regulator